VIEKSRERQTVFVVHGRNQQARDSVFQFLRAVGLRPREWLAMLTEIGPCPTIEQIVRRSIRQADAIVIVLTGDDEVRLRAPLVSQNDTAEEIHFQSQARPNVLFELGLALAVAPKRTVILQIGKVKSFSDIAGRHVLRMSNSKRHEFAERLRAAGCVVDTSGEDWLTAGDFELSLPAQVDREQLLQDYRAYLDRWLLLPFSSRHGESLSAGLVEEHMVNVRECIVRTKDAPAGDVMAEIRLRIAPRPDLKESRLPICLVTDSTGRLAGVITPSDLIAKYTSYHGRDQALVQDVWTANPWVLDSADTVADAIRKIVEKGVLSGMPVTRQEFPVGFLPHPGRRELVG
jgi:CBS domain-containing protein